MATSKTEKPVTGFRGRSGRTFRAKLKLEQNDEGKWRVEFDEDWAREPRPQPPAEEDGANGAGAADGDAAATDGGADGAKPDGGAPEREPQKTA
jgi:DNA topoisomerase-3